MPSYKTINSYLEQIGSDKSKALVLTVGSHEDVATGTKIPKADAQNAPEIRLPASLLSDPSAAAATYIAVGLDIDAPFQSWRGLGPIQHWVQPGFKVDDSGKLTTSEPFIVDYIGPAPPPPSGPHRYCFFLYKQPETLDVSKYVPKGGKKVGPVARMWFDLEKYEKQLGLAGGFVAGNYFISN